MTAGLLCLSLIFGVEAKARANLSGIGIKFGINSSRLVGNDAELSKPKLGICLGGFLTYSFTGWVAIQPEFLLTMKGDKWDSDMGKGHTNLDYLEIPVLLKMQLPTGTNLSPSFFAGPYLGIKLNAKAKMDQWESSDQGSQLVSTSTTLQGNDFGLVIGAGLDIGRPGERRKVALDLRYSRGLNSIDEGSSVSSQAANVRNSVFTLALGFSF